MCTAALKEKHSVIKDLKDVDSPGRVKAITIKQILDLLTNKNRLSVPQQDNN